ncbi:MAG: bifunctional folylpolyglutamate synthase/dihydrofolate synthase [Candidatus Dormibacteria bacterium]
MAGAPTKGTSLSEALAALDARGRFGIRPGLERTRELLDHCGSPDRALRGVLVAGTNGKGSVCALLDAMARAAGRSTALLAKPHLVRWNERIGIDGEPIADARLAELIGEVLGAAETMADPPTQFEVLTVVGALASVRAGVDLTICEVGMGGRLDSTNCLRLGGSVITAIDLDHREWLGDTVAEIAAEKAGILNAGDWVATAESGVAGAVVAERAAAVGAEVLRVEAADWAPLASVPGAAIRLREGLRVATSLAGAHQQANLALAVRAARRLGLADPAIQAGAVAVRWPGRLQWLPGTPPLLLDGAHNPAAFRALVGTVPELAGGRPVTAIFGAMADKQVAEMLSILAGLVGDRIVLTGAAGARSALPDALRAAHGAGEVAPDVDVALRHAETRAGADGVVLVCGSLALVGEVLRLRG